MASSSSHRTGGDWKAPPDTVGTSKRQWTAFDRVQPIALNLSVRMWCQRLEGLRGVIAPINSSNGLVHCMRTGAPRSGGGGGNIRHASVRLPVMMVESECARMGPRPGAGPRPRARSWRAGWSPLHHQQPTAVVPRPVVGDPNLGPGDLAEPSDHDATLPYQLARRGLGDEALDRLRPDSRALDEKLEHWLGHLPGAFGCVGVRGCVCVCV